MIRLAVFERELLRTARRRNTYLGRFLFGLGLLCVLMAFWIEDVELALQFDRSRLATVGKQLFDVYSGVQIAALLIITPIVVAQGMIEERDEKTLELLAITHLTPEAILWGKLLSRLLGVGSLALTGLPLIALSLSLGGVEPLAVVNLALQTAAVMLAAGGVACFLGMFAQGPIIAAAQTWMWLFLFFTAGGTPVAIVFSPDGYALANPVYALLEVRGWWMLGPILVYGGLVAGVVRVGAACFGSMAGGADDEDGGFGALSASVWRLEAIKRRSLGLVFVLLGGFVVIGVVNTSSAVPDEVGEGLVFLWNLGALWVGTVGFLLLSRWSLLRRRRPPKRKVGWRRMQEEMEAEDAWADQRQVRRSAADAVDRSEEAAAWVEAERAAPEPAVGAAYLRTRNLSGRSADVAEAASRPGRKRWFLREVKGNPVFWRETVTRAHGNLGKSLFRWYLLFIGILILQFAVGVFDGPGSAEVLLAMSAISGLGAALTTSLIASSSMASERRAGTLELVCTTRLGPRGVVAGKFQAIIAFAGPAYAIAVILALPGVGAFDLPSVTPYGLLVRWFMLGAWGAAALAFVAQSSLSIGLRATTPGRIWMLNILWLQGLFLFPLFLAAVGEGNAPVEFLAALLIPVFHEEFFEFGGFTAPTLLSTVWWSMAAAWMFRDNARRIREYA